LPNWAGNALDHETGRRDMTNDNTIIAEVKIKMAMILQDNENIEDLRFRPVAMVKNFEPKTRRRFKGITKAIFKYDLKQLAKAEREMGPVKGENVDIVVRWALNLAATRIFGIVKHWPATSMRGVHAEEPREDERPANGLRRESKAALNRRYIGSVLKFHRWLYEGGRVGPTWRPQQRNFTNSLAPASREKWSRRNKSPRSRGVKNT
jgi:hypothetical protein